MEFKRANLEDIILIRGLADIIFHSTYKDLISPEQMEYMFEWMYSIESLKEQMQSGHSFFLAYKNKELCAFFSVELEDEPTHTYHLQKLYLLPQYHGTGAGTELLRGVMDHIKKESPSKAKMLLNVNRQNKRAISFYEKNGLIKLKSVDVNIAEDFYMNDYIMGIEFIKSPK